MSLRNQVFDRVSQRVFHGRIIDNAARGDVVEEIVLMALEPEWKLCSEGWHGWDLMNADGHRMQVRQSAACQIWESRRPSPNTFSFAPTTGYYVGGESWIEEAGRHADLYVFAWHGGVDREAIDQLDPNQWRFFVVLERELPAQKSMRVSIAEKRWEACSFDQLANFVREKTLDLMRRQS